MIALLPLLLLSGPSPAWVRHDIATDFRSNTAVAADFTGDGRPDVVASDSATKQDTLFIAPDWRRVVIGRGSNPIHSLSYDVNGDGRPDFVAAQYSPGLLYWLECPQNAAAGPWKMHTIDDARTGGVDGIHGLALADVDKDGTRDLIANSALPAGPYAISLAWFRMPAGKRHIFARRDAPGLSHYFGVGDVNGDGRIDIASGAKTGDDGNWFAWWEQPRRATSMWKRHTLPGRQEGASNIFIVDVNRDGKQDFLASRGHGRGLLWYEAPSWTAHEIDAEHRYPHSLAVGDLDGDGDTDAVACSAVYDKEPADPALAWFENDGNGRFTAHSISRSQASYHVTLTDMDGDGDLDIVVAGQESRNVAWYENRLRR